MQKLLRRLRRAEIGAPKQWLTRPTAKANEVEVTSTDQLKPGVWIRRCHRRYDTSEQFSDRIVRIDSVPYLDMKGVLVVDLITPAKPGAEPTIETVRLEHYAVVKYSDGEWNQHWYFVIVSPPATAHTSAA
jgi:hypothetical protein